MLSDEMTTGSVTSSDANKRAYAVRSHAWNIAQSRFKEAFPEYCSPVMRDLPNMGEKERGKPDPKPTFRNPVVVSPLQPSTHGSSLRGGQLRARELAETPRPTTPGVPGPAPGWAATWRHFFYEKWRLCAFIALAVMVSRFSSRT